MYEVSEEYLDAVAGKSRYFHVRCKFDGIEEYLTDRSYIRSGTYTNIIDGNNILSMGNACSNKIEITVGDFRQPYVWKGSRFSIEQGLTVNGVTEWAPWGTFWVTDMSTPNDNRKITLTAYDRMYKFAKMKYTTALEAPFHYTDLLNEFLTFSGLTLSTTAELPDPSDTDYKILSFPEGEYSYADIAAHLAGMVCCNARISRADPNVIEFVWYTPTGTVIEDTLYQDGFEKLADSALRVDYLVAGANKEGKIEIENGDGIDDGELDFTQFDAVDPALVPWLTFTYDATTLTASVSLTPDVEYPDPVSIPGSLSVDGAIYEVTSIPDNGFRGVEANTVLMPDTMQSVGTYAFAYSTIETLTIPESVTSLGSYLLLSCHTIKTIRYNAINATGNGSAVFDGTTAQTFVIGENVQTIPARMLQGCSGITHIRIPSSVVDIKNNAFDGCNLTSVTFDGGVTIDAYAFNNCDSLTAITIPDSVKSIGDRVFYGCDNLKSIQIGTSAGCQIESIHSYAFANDKIEDITIYKTAGGVSGSPWNARNATITWVLG